MSDALTQHPVFGRGLVAERLRSLEAAIDLLFPVHQARIFRQLIEQVVVGKDSYVLRVSIKEIFDLMSELLDEN